MPLSLYNSLSRKKVVFTPADPAAIKMYVCGPTVYDRAHIGNARAVVVFDILFRLLRHAYGEAQVTYVRNITDVDDKINAAAKANGEDIRTLTERTTGYFHEDMAALNALPPTIEPRATEHIDGIITMVKQLIANRHAYESEGHIYFRVSSDENYGLLSGRTRDEMIDGARVEISEHKEDPADFVLWKPSGDDLPGWDSPWGRGRPGWHIECSVMSTAYFGADFDIHGGGADLIFPHHENEIAQSTCAHHGSTYAKYWVHNGFLTVEGEKMSKSLGNFFTVRDLLDKGIHGETMRLLMLTTHYRSPLDWSDKAITDAKKALDSFYRALTSTRSESPEIIPENVLDALYDDMNFAPVLETMHQLARQVNREQSTKAAGELQAIGNLLGLLQEDPHSWFKGDSSANDGLSEQEIETLIDARKEAKVNRDFAEADRIRQELTEAGITLEDKPDGKTEWRRG